MQHDGIGNACGTIACLHAVANAGLAGNFELQDGPLRAFLQASAARATGLSLATSFAKLTKLTKLTF